MDGSRDALRQRADYTQKFNRGSGRHGWLRLTPAYSVKIVEEIVARHPAAGAVLDPFCGTGTTALCAAARGHAAATLDINPFLVWFAGAKTARYDAAQIEAARDAGAAALDLVRRAAVAPAPEPPIHNIDRWWPAPARRVLCRLKPALAQAGGGSGPVADLLGVAFCRTLIALSNAAFDHQSLSFRRAAPDGTEVEARSGARFADDLAFVLAGAADNPPAPAAVRLGDARALPEALGPEARFDLVITSPPYANRMSYIRELRPYMYWLDYLEDRRDAAELDWRAIGGTWGVATSRLKTWSPDRGTWLPEMLPETLAGIAREANANGPLLANYVAKYCADMSAHFASLREVLAPGARLRYIVGNSTFYGVLVPTEQIYAAMLRHYGFEEVEVRPVRKRNSKKALIEFDVSARWGGG